MRRFNVLLVNVLVAAATLLSLPAITNAANTQTSFNVDMNDQLTAAAGTQGANLGNPTDPRKTIIFIIRLFLNLIGLILLCLNLYAGFLWLTAGGNDEQIAQAKGYIRNGVIGLIIVLSAYSITIFAANIARIYTYSPLGPFIR
jgi:hypothetical protein